MEASQRTTVLVLLVALALALGACSGSDDTTTTEAATTTTAATTTSTGAETTTTTATTSTEASAGAITISNFSFTPGDITVAAGTTVTWTNGDDVNHTTTSDDDVWDSGGLGFGSSFEVVFDEPGVYAYHCNIHRTMTGTVTVEG